MSTAQAGKLESIRDAREAFEFKPEDTDDILLARDAELRPKLTDAQRAELDDEEVVELIDDQGWALTVGGVYIEPDGNRNFGGC